MMSQIAKIGVLGAGTMGATIAAHFANIELPVVLLDIIPTQIPPQLKNKNINVNTKEYRNFYAKKGLENVIKTRPAAFYIPENAELITLGNLEDDLELLTECDWIIEAIVEELSVKKELLAKIEKVRKTNAIVSTNTSGISISKISEFLSEECQMYFLGTHFFNPPRYMKLFEIIPGPKTSPDIITLINQFAEQKLGKGVIIAKDTPNFIANRIGGFVMSNLSWIADEMDLSFETIDTLTGNLIGRPNLATYKMADLVGLDIFAHVADNIYHNALNDEQRKIFLQPSWLTQMIEKGYLGKKTNGGFYKKVTGPNSKKITLVLDRKTMKYREPEKVNYPSLELAKQQAGASNKIKTLFYGNDKAANLIFKHISELLCYTANRIPEISDNIINIDNALKLGFNWKIGPFEIWDAIDINRSTNKMEKAGYIIPSWVKEMLATGYYTFYKKDKGTYYYYDKNIKTYKQVDTNPNIILLPSVKEQNKIIATNSGATLIDLDDGVACLEFHTKMNSIGQDIILMIEKAVNIVNKNFNGLVIANHGNNFSVGANLALVLFTAQEEEWDELHWMVKKFQDTFMMLKYLEKPVVAAPHQMALGGGFEICLAVDKIVAASETYMGLVEVGVGLIPAGGGTKELLIRNTSDRLFEVIKGGIYPKQIPLLPFVARTFETIIMAKVSSSAKEAFKIGLLNFKDKICINDAYRIKQAKNTVLAMTLEGYTAPKPNKKIRVMGRDAMGIFKYVLYNMHKAKYITEYDITVGNKLAWVLTGGDILPETEVTEQYLLDLEREAFVSLCGIKQTQDRISHMLKYGKPLRN